MILPLRCLRIFSVSISATLLYSPAFAAIEELIVTTQKKTQTSEEIPFSVTPLNGQHLENLNATSISALSALTPGLYIRDADPNLITYSIRGIGGVEPSAQRAPRVAIYLNEVDISRNRSSYIELYDMDRIEVIKGPQATLFGTTASAGAIAYYTNRPEIEESGAFSIGMGSDSLLEFGGYATGGNNTVQGRIAFLTKDQNGYFPQTSPNGTATNEPLGSIKRQAIRSSLRWKINDEWQADIVYSHEEADDTISPNKSGVIAAINGDTSPYSAASLSGNPLYSELFPHTGFTNQRRTDDVNIRISRQQGQWTFSSISGYRQFDVTSPYDADGSQAWAFELFEESDGHQVSQDFQLGYEGEKAHIIGGISYFKEKAARHFSFSADEGSYIMCVPTGRAIVSQLYQQSALLNPQLQPLADFINPANQIPCANADGSINSLSPVATGGALLAIPYVSSLSDYGNNTSKSAFVDIEYTITDKFSLNAGLRYIDEKRRSGFSAYSPTAALLQYQLPLLILGDTHGETLYAGNSDNDLLFRINASYQWRNNHYIYTSYSEGRRSAVTEISTTLDANFQSALNLNQIPAEILKNYEIGVKGKTTNWRYSAAIYQQDYTNFQVTYIDGNGRFVALNAGDTSNPGAEAELVWQVQNNIQLFANMAVMDHTFDDSATNEGFAGKNLAYTSEKTASLGIIYDDNISDTLGLFFNLYGNYRSEVTLDELSRNIEPISGLSLIQPSIVLVNGSVGLYKQGEWKIQLWAENLTDKNYLLGVGSIGTDLGMPTYTAAPTRSWGIKVKAEF